MWRSASDDLLSNVAIVGLKLQSDEIDQFILGSVVF